MVLRDGAPAEGWWAAQPRMAGGPGSSKGLAHRQAAAAGAIRTPRPKETPQKRLLSTGERAEEDDSSPRLIGDKTSRAAVVRDGHARHCAKEEPSAAEPARSPAKIASKSAAAAPAAVDLGFQDLAAAEGAAEAEAWLRRGHFVILPLQIWFIWQIPIVTRNASDE
jgi:hypothetical protein